jgi:hypothetical protein
MQTTFNLDLSTLKPHQREAFLALVQTFLEPYFIPSSDETNVDETVVTQ